MKIRKPVLWIILLILALAVIPLGIRYMIPRVFFAPDDPALQTPSPEDSETEISSPEETTAPARDEVEGINGLEPPPHLEFSDLRFEAEILAENLHIPWEIRYLADEDDWLITQRSGELISLRHGTIAVIEETAHTGEGGLLGLALDPEFTENRHLYLYVTTQSGGTLINRVLRYTYINQRLQERTLILDNIPGARFHNGGRIDFGPDGMLYITTGDAVDPSLAQQEASLAGKILRIEPDGTIPPDNPDPGSPVYSMGHRNPQGLAWHPQTGELFASEHGPTQMDEVNLIRPGGNYGWPLVTCDQAPTDFDDPLACYTGFTLAPAGMTFYQPDGLAGTHLLVSGLRGNQVRHLVLSEENLPLSQEPLFTEWGRIRTVMEQDGDLYLITNNQDGRGTPHPSDDRLIRLRLLPPEQ